MSLHTNKVVQLLPIHPVGSLEGFSSGHQTLAMMITSFESVRVQQGLSRFVSIRHDGDGFCSWHGAGSSIAKGGKRAQLRDLMYVERGFRS